MGVARGARTRRARPGYGRNFKLSNVFHYAVALPCPRRGPSPAKELAAINAAQIKMKIPGSVMVILGHHAADTGHRCTDQRNTITGTFD
jgi:hypothetical protein